jgi:hypothetical protein
VIDTLAVAAQIDQAQVAEEVAAVRSAGHALIAGGHLAREPMVLSAAELRLEISTAHGDDALTLDENLNVVPGAAAASDWTLFIPTPEPIGRVIEASVDGLEHVSVTPPTPQVGRDHSAALTLNAEALRERTGDRL